MADLILELQDVFREVFDDPELAIDRSISAEDVEGWDSMMHINLVIATEKTFGVRFATAEISALKEEGKNVGDYVDLLAQKIALRA